MENFVVSARKYRPATFASVVGQHHITSTLKNAISRGQLAHAYLFCGPRGVGKTTCARIFAKAINCLSPVDAEACNRCESCRGFNEGRSFNIHELDAASNNSVDDIRSLTEQVRIPPQIGRYSVYIIDEVHMLSAAAFNAFLKTLEEPPAHAVFILATTEKHKILPTILSRCQIFDFNRIRVEDSVSYLKYIASQEGVTADDESLHLIAQKADGGMRDALSMFDKAVSFCGNDLNFREVAQTLNVLDYDTYFTVTKLILAGDYPGALLLLDDVLRKGFSGQTFLTGLNGHFRDILMCKSPDTLKLLEVTGSLLERYKQQGADCDVGFLFEAISLLTALDGSLRTSSNQRLSVELGLMKLCGLGQKKNDAAEPVTAPQLPPLRSDRTVSAPAVSPAEPVSGADRVSRPAASAVSPAIPDETATAPKPVRPAPAPEPAGPAPVVQPPQEEKPQPPAPHTVRSISGLSIASIMNASRGSYTGEAVPDENRPGQEAERVDPDSERKIRAAATGFLHRMERVRPRIAMAFREMRAEGNTVKVSVPNEPLREEILRNQTEILSLLIEVAALNGTAKLEVTVVEEVTGLKPIRVEDRLKFLTEKNPLLATLRKEMDLDVE